MLCEMCGAHGPLYRAIIEDSEMAVCGDCSGFGKVLGKIDVCPNIKKPASTQTRTAETVNLKAKQHLPEKLFEIIEDYPDMIKKKREQMGMTQKDFAKFVAERESVIHKIETGAIEPNIKMARKLEKMLKVKLIEQYEEKRDVVESQSSGDQFTIGDIITIKRKA